MKKISFIFMLIFLTFSSALAQSNLYTLQNTKKEDIIPYIESAINGAGYIINKKDPYYASNANDTQDYLTAILQKSGNDTLYYFNSAKNKKINKNILKAFKNIGISYYETNDENYLNIFEKQSENLVSGIVKNYSFDVWNYTEPAIAINTEEDDSVLKGKIIQIEKGVILNAYLQTPINTANAKAGDNITAILSENLTYNGYTIAQQGSVISGTLSKAHSATYGSRNGRVVIDFTTLTAPDNKTYKISTEAIDFSVTNEGKISKSAKNIATGAVIGAIGGLLVAALSSDSTSIGKAVLIGAGTGMASGAVASAAERGVDAEIPIYTELEIKLTKPFKAVFY